MAVCVADSRSRRLDRWWSVGGVSKRLLLCRCAGLAKWCLIFALLCFGTCGVVVPRPRTSKACSIGCPPGTFESSPCTNFRDRVCQECTKCRGSTYEAKSCSGTTDRQCIHVAHPLLITDDVTTDKFLDELHQKKLEMKKRKKLKVEASSNVFLEDLHTMRNLETTYYVTDKTQASDFFWNRESGLRVNIGILNVHLISEYVDVDHESDNKYVLNSPDGSEDKTKFRSLLREFCRHPIPDSYQLTLEILRDRTTAVQNVVCDSSNATKPRCPHGFKDGDVYLYRTANEACQKMGTFPKVLEQAANSIVCTEHSALMSEIFNQTHSHERQIRFPPRKCRTAKHRCEQCIEQVRCQALEIFEKKCCEIDCYTLLDCKVAYSEECVTSPVECAMGDAYHYTIQPVFGNLETSHQCHIKRQHSDILYEVFYFVQVPGTQFQTSKVHRTLYASQIGDQRHGANMADFLNIEHNIGMELEDEFFLHRQQVDTDQFNHTVISMQLLDELQSNRLQIHEISPQVFIASTQFERPFDYSTSTWTRPNDCHRNISKFRTVVSYGAAQSQGVSVTIQNATEPFHYFLKSTDNPPFIRFNVPGNMSILPFYFRDSGPVLYTNGSLIATLELTSSGRIWDIHLSGKLSGCPGYVGVVISNREEQEELFRYDLLVLCPSDFNITFRVPNWGQHQDKTFDIHLEDAKHSYDIYLTQLTFEQVLIELEPEAIQMPQQQKISSVVFFVVIASLFTSFIAFIAVYVYTEAAKEKTLQMDAQGSVKLYSGIADGQKNSTSEQQQASNPTTKSSNFRASCLFRLYVVFRIVYSVLFTFTVFYVVLSFVISDDVEELSQIEALQLEKQNVSTSLSMAIEQHSNEELSRQRDLVTNMQSSCIHYTGELFDIMALQMDKILTTGKRTEGLFRLNVSVSSAVEKRIQTRLTEFRFALAGFRNNYQSQVTSGVISTLDKYRKYLSSVLQNNWLSFPQKLFHDSAYSEEQALSALKASGNLTGVEVDFGNFLEIQEVEEIQLWAGQLWQRFSEKFPQLPPVPAVQTGTLQCTLDEDDVVPNLTRRTPLYQLYSSHFFTSYMTDDSSDDIISGPIVSLADHSVFPQGKRNKAAQKQDTLPTVFSMQLFLDGLNTDVLRIAFLVLDILVLLYRCTLTYMTARALRRRFSNSSLNRDRCFLYQWPSQQLNDTSQTAVEALGHDHESATGVETTTATPGVLDQSNISNQNNIYTDPQTLIIQNISSLQRPSPSPQQISFKTTSGTTPIAGYDPHRTSMRVVFGRLIENDAFPKVIILAMFVVLVYAFLRVVNVFLDIKFLVAIRAFGVFVNVLSVHVNQTNIYILDQAKFFNEVTMKAFEAQMNVELVNLQSMLEFFNAEQKRLVNNYVAELCSLADVSYSQWGCDSNTAPLLLTVPMIPCNFVPIQPHLFSGFKVRDYESQLEASFQGPVEAARNIVLKALYGVLVALTVMMVIHIFGWITGRCFRLRHRGGSGPSLQRTFVPGAPGSLRADSSIQTFVHRHDVSDYDSDENDVEFTRHTTVTNITMYRGRTGVAEFKYSETNV